MNVFSKVSRYGRRYEDFTVGEIIEHRPAKTITESDNNLFCLLTMNHHPVHLDHHYAASSHHGKVLVVGTLTFSLSVGLTVSEVSGAAIANLAYEDVRHLAPVFLGDTINVKTEVLGKKLWEKSADRGIVYVETVTQNQNEEEVLSFRRRVLVPASSQEHSGF